jgi:hypothetical protein
MSRIYGIERRMPVRFYISRQYEKFIHHSHRHRRYWYSHDGWVDCSGALQHQLSVASGATQYGNLFFSDSGSSVAGYIQYLHGTDYLRFGTAATERLRISDNGDINFYEDTGTTVKLFWDASLESLMLNASTRVGTEILTVNGTVTTGGGTASGPALAFRADSNTGIFRPASQALGFSTAGTERLRIDASGHAIIPEGVTLGTAAGVYSAANTLDDYNSITTIRLSDGRHRQEQHNGIRKSNNRRQD